MLTKDQVNEFDTNGMLIIKDFYDIAKEIIPVQSAIYQIIGFVIARHSIEFYREPFNGGNFDNGYLELISINRNFGAEVYDLVKQIPAFIRLISSKKAEDLFCYLRTTDAPGIGAASYGIRIDNPFEGQYRSQWHQEFLFQPQSLDGIVLWTPLIPITSKLGPVMVCAGSHKNGLCMYSKSQAYANKSGAYKIGIHKESDIVSRYRQVEPLIEPGDLMIMDFLTIHQSGFNTSNRSRWSVQSRFFNFKEEVGAKIGWKASITAGSDVEEIFPDNFVE